MWLCGKIHNCLALTPNNLLSSLELAYRTKDGRSETTTVNIRPDWASNDTYRLQAVLTNGPQRVLQFNFEQRRGHLAGEDIVHFFSLFIIS